MNELIVITNNVIGDKEVNSVVARDLWTVLESKQDYSNWFKNKVLDNIFFIENEDYILLNNSIERATTGVSAGGHNRKDYALKVEAAKRVAMSEHTSKGEEVRTYFLNMQTKAEAILSALESIDYTGNINDLVFSKSGVGFTTSRIIAAKFEKRHSDVLRAIDTHLQSISNSSVIQEFNEHNFVHVEYVDAKQEVRRAYELTEKGFITLGFTGVKAVEFKIDFINAFFAMRDAITNRLKAEVVKDLYPAVTGKRNFVYIIGNSDNSYIKIGVSSDVENRIKQLQTGSWSELGLLYKSMACSNSFDIETRIHNKLKDKRIHGEWYDLSEKEAITLIEAENHKLTTAFLQDYFNNNETKFMVMEDTLN